MSDNGLSGRRQLVLGSGSAFAVRVGDHFREMGWDVHTAADVASARRLAVRNRVAAALIPASGGLESGFLTCLKLRQAHPRLRVVLIGDDRTLWAARFAEFVGACYVGEGAGVDEVSRMLKA